MRDFFLILFCAFLLASCDQVTDTVQTVSKVVDVVDKTTKTIKQGKDIYDDVVQSIVVEDKSSETRCNVAKDGAEIDYYVYVVGVVDGDTFDGLTSQKETQRFRLSGVDAPEKGQPYGKRSKQYLSGLIFNKNIGVDIEVSDAYGRYVATIYDEQGNDLCAEMLRAGMAHHFRKYDSSEFYEQLEIEARENGVGLWESDDVIEPCVWRKMSAEERDEHR